MFSIKESIFVIMKTIFLLSYLIFVEVYATGTLQIILVIGGIAAIVIYTWFTTTTVGHGDDDPSGNDNVNRKFTDYM